MSTSLTCAWLLTPLCCVTTLSMVWNSSGDVWKWTGLWKIQIHSDSMSKAVVSKYLGSKGIWQSRKSPAVRRGNLCTQYLCAVQLCFSTDYTKSVCVILGCSAPGNGIPLGSRWKLFMFSYQGEEEQYSCAREISLNFCVVLWSAFFKETFVLECVM